MDEHSEYARVEAEVRKSRRRQRLPLIVSAAVLIIIVAAAIFAPVISPHDPLRQNIFQRLQPPFWMEGGSTDHLLGTDALGRDVLSRIVHGARTSLAVGILAVLVGGATGVALGMLAGYFQKSVDAVLGRLADIQQTLPFIVLILALVAVIGPSKANLVLVLGIGSWVYYYRIVRGEVTAVRARPYIEAAHAIGASTTRIIVRHILPERAAVGHRYDDAVRSSRHAVRSGAQLPRPRCTAAGADVGRHHRGRPRVHRDRLVD